MTEFDRIYLEYFEYVEHYLLAICKDEHLAEELTEQVFFQALKALPRFQGSCDIRTWLCAIGRNAYLTHLRKNKPTEPIEDLQIPDPQMAMEERMANADNSTYSTTIPPEKEAIAQCWYANIWDGTAAVPLLKDGDMEKPMEPVVIPRYDLFFIIGAMLTAAAILVIFSRFVKEQTHTDFIITAAFLFSLSLGILLHHGGQLVEYCSGFESSVIYYLYELRDGLWVGIPLFLTILCGRKLHQWKKEDALS